MNKIIILFLTFLYVDCLQAVADALPRPPTIEFAAQRPSWAALPLEPYRSGIATPLEEEVYQTAKRPFEFSNQQEKVRTLRFWLRVLYFNLADIFAKNSQKYDKLKIAEQLVQMTDEELMELSEEQLAMITQLYPEFKTDESDQVAPAETEEAKVEALRNKLPKTHTQQTQVQQSQSATTPQGSWKQWWPTQKQAVSAARKALKVASALPYVPGAANILGASSQSNVGASAIPGATTSEAQINADAVQELVGPRNISWQYLGSTPTNSQVSPTFAQGVQRIQMPKLPRIK
jgi:hypothetical protein